MLINCTLLAQSIDKDTIAAKKYFDQAIKYKKATKYDSAIVNFENAGTLYIKNNLWVKYLVTQTSISKCFLKKQQFNEGVNIIKSALEKALNQININNYSVADAYHNLGVFYYYLSKNDSVLKYWTKELQIKKQLYGEKHISVAGSYNNIGLVYRKKAEFNKALEYYYKDIAITKKLKGDTSNFLASSYNNVGVVLYYKGQFRKALEYQFKSLQIKKRYYKKENTSIARNYNNIALIYGEIMEYDKAIEFYNKSIEILKAAKGESSFSVASAYNNIGVVYNKKGEYNKALEIHKKCLHIKMQLYEAENQYIANTYNNLGDSYYYMSEYDSSLKYYNKSLSIRLNELDSNHKDVAESYNNIGLVYQKKHDYDKALKYLTRALGNRKVCLGWYHDNTLESYKNIASTYQDLNNLKKALQFYHLATLKTPGEFKHKDNIAYIPSVNINKSNNIDILHALESKADIFARKDLAIDGLKNDTFSERMNIALNLLKACDQFIHITRKRISKKSDKLALGEIANQVYRKAINICLEMAKYAKADSSEYYKKLAFQYSEKNKASVLLESLAGAEAMEFAGIPGSILEKERELKTEITFFKKMLAENTDSIKKIKFRNKLFKFNRSYDSLMKIFEDKYPKYHELKYGQKLATVGQLQRIIDNNTAMISFTDDDNDLITFVILKNKVEVHRIKKKRNYEDMISLMRMNLGTPYGDGQIYLNSAQEIHAQLFNFEIPKAIKNLVIIPSGSTSLIPFEALITEKYNGKLEAFNNYPYLIHQYNISYSYSANLYYRTFPKEKTKKVEVTPLNDWLAFAPIFDDKKSSGATLRTREMLRSMDKLVSDSNTTRGRVLNGNRIAPLPGTREEVQTIFSGFENQQKKALVNLRASANEDYVKSGKLKDYKYIHFASHGMVNTDKPELSGIILAQDSASKEDGILHTGEMYNLELNADLTVLSACETGLGEITKGEGLIGLSRALLYAGSKNIIVSLWKVADNSTSQLMVDFYDNLLQDEKNRNYSQALREAKLKMIAGGKYAHPFYWSPFILIGK